MAAEFNVAVLATLRNRVSSGLRIIASEFGRAELRARDFQRSLNELHLRHLTTMQRNDIDRRRTADLKKQLETRRAMLAASIPGQRGRIEALEKEAELRERAGRLRANKLRGQKKIDALTAVEARRAKDNLATERLKEDLQKRQLALTERQYELNRRMELQRIRDTQLQNRLLREQGLIAERQARARHERRMGLLKMGGAVAVGAAATAYELAKAGLPVGMYLQQIGAGANLSALQRQQLPNLALQMSAQSGRFSYKQILRSFRTLMPLYGFNAIKSLGPQLYDVAALASYQGFGSHPTTIPFEIMRTLYTLHARTPQQRSEVFNALTAMMYRGHVSPRSATEALRSMGVISARLPFGQRIEAGALAAIVEQMGGRQMHLSQKDIAEAFSALLLPTWGGHLAIRQLLNPHHLSLTGPHGMANIAQIISHAPLGLTLAQRIIGGRQGLAYVTLNQLLRSGLMGRVQSVLSGNMTPQSNLAKALTKSQPAMLRLGAALDSFVTVVGSKIAPHTTGIASWLASGFSGAAEDINKSPSKWLKGFASWLFLHNSTPALLYRELEKKGPHGITEGRRLGFWGNPLPAQIHHHHNTVHVTVDSDERMKKLVRSLKTGVNTHTRANGTTGAPVHPRSVF